MSSSSEVRELIDRAAITDIVIRYTRAVETADVDLFVSCFTEDGVLDYGADVYEGQPAIRRHFADNTGSPTATIAGIDGERVSTPVANQIEFFLDEDTARTETSATIYHAGMRDGRPVVVVRGIRYSDAWMRTDHGWRIACRRHRNRWAFETSATGIWHADGSAIG